MTAKKPPKKKMGRPTLWDEPLCEEICIRLAEGQSLRTIVLDPNMPAHATVYRWLSQDENFRDKYMRARDSSADADFEQLADIAADVLSGDLDPQAARVASDLIKWIAGRKKPKKYSDKLVIAGDSESPLDLVLREVSGKTLEPPKE